MITNKGEDTEQRAETSVCQHHVSLEVALRDLPPLERGGPYANGQHRDIEHDHADYACHVHSHSPLRTVLSSASGCVSSVTEWLIVKVT